MSCNEFYKTDAVEKEKAKQRPYTGEFGRTYLQF